LGGTGGFGATVDDVEDCAAGAGGLGAGETTVLV
jgi:hypothetical protein